MRPLALVGRGGDLGADVALSPGDLARLTLLADLLGAGDGVGVRVGLAAAGALRAQAREAHVLLTDDVHQAALSDLVNPLILDERGRLLPFAYGIHPRLAIVEDLDGLAGGVAAWKADGAERLRDLVDRALQALPEPPEAQVDWYDHLTRTSHEPQWLQVAGTGS